MSKCSPSSTRASPTAKPSNGFNRLPSETRGVSSLAHPFETYCRGLVSQGYELYIIAGGDGSKGRIDSHRINVPDWTWKVVVVLPNGSSDLSRVTTSTRVITIDMPNDQGIRADDWREYRSNVDTIEYYTGYDFLSLVPASVQSVIEARVDNL